MSEDEFQELLFQEEPIYSHSNNSAFNPKSWTASVVGYLAEAKQWATCVNLNRQLLGDDYTWAVNINHQEVLPVAQLKEIWKKACRKLRRQGIEAIWIREVNLDNKLHYHLILKNKISGSELSNIIEQSMPARSEIPWRKWLEPIFDQFHYPYYIFKAKIAKEVYGKLYKDYYGSRRLLFQPGLGMNKVGTIGKFWAAGMTKAKLWQTVRDKEKLIADNLALPGVQPLIDHIEAMLCSDISQRSIARSIAIHAQKPSIQQWINRSFRFDNFALSKA